MTDYDVAAADSVFADKGALDPLADHDQGGARAATSSKREGGSYQLSEPKSTHWQGRASSVRGFVVWLSP